MMKSALVALSLLAVGTTAASAQEPTAQQQAACRSDAMKFCASNIGKPAEMRACLKANSANLSDACRQVVEASGG